MEDFIYILLVVAWVVAGLLKRKSKKTAAPDRPRPKQAPAPVEETSDVEQMLEQFFGGKEKKKEEKANMKQEPVFDAGERKEERTFRKEERDSRREIYAREEIPVEEEPVPEAFQEYSDYDATPPPKEEISVQSVEDLIKLHAEKDAIERALAAEQWDAENIPEFDVRTAVIFSEILNRKYS